LVDQAVEIANHITSPLFGKIEFLDAPFKMRTNRYFHTSPDFAHMLADRDAQCVADVVTNHAQMEMYYGWKTINGKTYIGVKVVPKMDDDDDIAAPPSAPSAVESKPLPESNSSWEDVLPQVKRKCAGQWSDDYNMQSACIRIQREGWDKLHADDQPHRQEPSHPLDSSPVVSPSQQSAPEPYYTASPNPAPLSNPRSSPSAPQIQDRGSVEARATNLVVSYYDLWSQTTTNVEGLTAYYADSVNFYGANISRSKIMDEKRKFSLRWPKRAYTIRRNTLFAQCSAPACSVSGTVEWDASSIERNEHSTGLADFVLKIVLNDSVIGGLIVSENGAVMSSHKEPLSLQASTVITQTDPTIQYSHAYADGRNARIAYQNWINALTQDDYRAGAEYWAANRTVRPPPATCRYSSPAFEQGCLEAKRQLTPADVRRKAEPDFKLGWNSP
jgi:hypothetical protein